ncbi:uncharacterized protein MONBRDRAFT_7828 [Monosiga brevicollis MX1]|uniref:Mediator of RNA polymerase II transcription subunit 6 n=1 Tax=Monosiga brevicollis TaxID=81824 RepID=A9UXJ4_MONBE|nr:uncharacterized protein MONBRDRAFT_7828 [Monosiga brevicollis MX1]EDQ90019.1 predicted protein [Monosiga brevicollis MX1]|eukprot:XP_001745441.1 hypothetical protein [Monosiga brevicollis MX1]
MLLTTLNKYYTEAEGQAYLEALSKQWYDNRLAPTALTNSDLALQYFAQPDTNAFYQRDCNNERVKQANFGLLDHQKLREMRGIEYEARAVLPPFLHHVVQKRRFKPSLALDTAYYYILNGNAYQAPDLSSLISSRLSSALHSLSAAFKAGQGCLKRAPQSMKRKAASASKHQLKYKTQAASGIQARQVAEALSVTVNSAAKTVADAAASPSASHAVVPSEEKPDSSTAA